MSENDEATVEDGATPKPKSRLPLIIGLFLFLALGGGGFFATFSGMLSLTPVLGGDDAEHAKGAKEHREPAAPGFAFVPVGEMVIPLGPRAEADVLIIESEIEVAPDDRDAVSALMPRIRDVFNTYLRALEESDLEKPGASIALRAQLLRRIRVVAEPVEPRDLLFTSFVFR